MHVDAKQSSQINPMNSTVLFVAQEIIPPAYEAVIWNGTVDCLQAIGHRYGISGHIDKDGNLNLQKRPETNYRDKISIGDYLVVRWTTYSAKYVDVLTGTEFIKRFRAHPNGHLTVDGNISL